MADDKKTDLRLGKIKRVHAQQDNPFFSDSPQVSELLFGEPPAELPVAAEAENRSNEQAEK